MRKLHPTFVPSSRNIQGNDWGCWLLLCPVFKPDRRNRCRSFRIQALSVSMQRVLPSLRMNSDKKELFNKQWVEDVKMNTVRPDTGLSAWRVLCSCVFVGNGNTFTLWQTLKCSLKCCGFNWDVENGLIFKGWWNVSAVFYLYKMDNVFLVCWKHMLTL